VFIGYLRNNYMNEYQIIVMRDDEEILSVPCEADALISTLCGFVGAFPGTIEDEVEPEIEVPAPRPKTAKKQRRERRCSACSRTGHTTRTCPSGASELPPKSDDPMSEDAFQSVKDLQRDGAYTTVDVAEMLELNQREVIAAWGATMYSGYMTARSSV
jgi:hypothetical protein